MRRRSLVKAALAAPAGAFAPFSFGQTTPTRTPLAVTYIGQATGVTSATLPTHQQGDLIVAFAFRDGSNSLPTVPAAWAVVTSGGANSCSSVTAYKVANAPGTASGTWTNATSVVFMVYRNAMAPGAAVRTSGTGTTVTYGGLTLKDTSGASWVAAFAGHRSTNTAIEGPPSGMVARADVVDSVDEAAAHDTAHGVGSWTAKSLSVFGTASGWQTSVLEIRARSVNPLVSWQAALAGVKAGTQRARILCVGDSITACYATAGTATVNSYQYAWPTVLASTFPGAPARATSFVSTHNVETAQVPYNTYDNRLVLGSGWGYDPEGTTGGGHFFLGYSAGTSLAFTPGATFDRAQVFYGTYDGSPLYTVNINGGATVATLAMSNPSEAYSNQTFSTTAGNNTLNIKATGNYGYIAGVITWTDSVKAVDIVNMGWYDSQAVDWAVDDYSFSPANTIPAFGAHLTVIMLGTNDRNSGNEEFYKENMRVIIAKAKTTGDVLIIAPPHGNPNVEGGTATAQAAWASYAVSLAYETDSAFINMQARTNWTSFNAANAAGFMDADGVHLSVAGYADLAAAVRAVVG